MNPPRPLNYAPPSPPKLDATDRCLLGLLCLSLLAGLAALVYIVVLLFCPRLGQMIGL